MQFKGLETVVSKAIASVTRIEDRAVNSYLRSDFSANHPTLSSFVETALIAAAFNSLQFVFPPETTLEQRLFIGSGGALAGLFAAKANHMWAKRRNILKRQGINPRRFDKLDDEALDARVESGRGVPNYILERPRRVAAAAVAALLAPANYHLSQFYPLHQLIIPDIVMGASLYLSSRSMLMPLKKWFNASAIKSVKNTVLAALAYFAANKTGSKRLSSLAISQAEKAAERQPSVETKLDLGTYLLEAGSIDTGLVQIKQAMEQKEEMPEVYKTVRGSLHLAESAHSFSAIESGTAHPGNYATIARAMHAIGEKERMLREIENMQTKFPEMDSKSLGIITALLLEVVNEKELARKRLIELAQAVYSDQNARREVMGEPGVHGVWTVESPMLSEIFAFKPYKIRPDREFEVRAVAYADSVKESRLRVPQVIWEFDRRNGTTIYDLLMRYDKGQSIIQMHENRTLRDDSLLMANDSMAWLHSSIPSELSAKGKVDLYGKLEQRLRNPNFRLPENLIESMLKHFQPLIERQQEAPFAFAGDFFHGKWLFGDYLTILDWEDKGVTSIFEDGAKFYIDPHMSFEAETVDKLLGSASASYNARGLFRNDSEFRMLQLEAMLLQAIFSASIWSDSEMGHMRDCRLQVINGAAKTFEMLGQNHSQHYTELQSGFRNVEMVMAA
jgi:hypothetical protein